jgi:glucose-6-phosphate isomerase
MVDATLPLLIDLAKHARVPAKIEAMFAGERINHTEQRAVLHTALRNRSGTSVRVDGRDVMPDVLRVLSHMRDFVEAIRSGALRGHTGKALTDVGQYRYRRLGRSFHARAAQARDRTAWELT